MRTKPIPLPLPQSSDLAPDSAMTTAAAASDSALPPSGPPRLTLTRPDSSIGNSSGANSAASSTDPEDVVAMMGPALPNGPPSAPPAVWASVEEDDDDDEDDLEELDEEEEEEEAAEMADIALDLSLAKPPDGDDPDMDEEMAEMALYDEEDGQSSSPGVADHPTPPALHSHPRETATPLAPPMERKVSPGPAPPLMLKRDLEHLPGPGHPLLLARHPGPPPPPLGAITHGSYCATGGAAPGGPGGDCGIAPLGAHCGVSAAATAAAAAAAAASLAEVMPDQGRLCPVCHKVFRFEKNLYRHMQKAHAAGDGESVLKCKLCNYTTKHYSNMYVHIRTHTGDKPYWCSACGASFTQGSSLKLHIRSRHQENMSFFSLTKKYGKNNLTKLWTRVLKKDLPKFTSPFNHNAAAAVAAAAVLENAKAMGGGHHGGASLFFPAGYGSSPLPPFSYFSPAAAAAAAAAGIVFPNGSSPGGPIPGSGLPPPPPPPPQPFFLGPTPPPPPPSIKPDVGSPHGGPIKSEPSVLGVFESDNPPPLGAIKPPSVPPQVPHPSGHLPPQPPISLSLTGPVPTSATGVFTSSPFLSTATLLPVGAGPFLSHSGPGGRQPLMAAVPTNGEAPPLNSKVDKCFQVGLSEPASVNNLRQENDRTRGQLDRLRESAKRLLLSLYSRSLSSAAAVRELNGEKIDDLMEHAAKTATSLEAAVALTQNITYE